MHRLTSKLILFRNIGEGSILFRLAEICRSFSEDSYIKERMITDIYEQVYRILDLATRFGFDKNLWHNYLAYLLAMTENPFTFVSEKAGAREGTVNEFVLNDFSIFKQLFDYDFLAMEKGLGINCFTTIQNYQAVVKKDYIYNKSVSEKVQKLSFLVENAKDEREIYRIVTDFYSCYGVGNLGLNKAFRLSNENRSEFLTPITATTDVILADLIGYEEQKKQLLQNTEAFVKGKPANNVLLYGDAGTGKSTSIKAILNQYYHQGLRMIELFKHESRELSKVIAIIKNRNYRFIIFMDDLSFEEFETDYKYLKAVIEGGLETKPENVLIYATSNRHHLIRETWTDRSDISIDELHRSDTVQEKLSLVGRFGITIGFFKPTPTEYFHIVKSLARKHPAITLTDEELAREANKWELSHGGPSGRTAQQLINYLLSLKE